MKKPIVSKKVTLTQLEYFVVSNGYSMEDTEFVELARKKILLSKTNPNPDDTQEFMITPFKCVFCGKTFENQFPNNAAPFRDGYCCGECNRKIKLAGFDLKAELKKDIEEREKNNG